MKRFPLLAVSLFILVFGLSIGMMMLKQESPNLADETVSSDQIQEGETETSVSETAEETTPTQTTESTVNDGPVIYLSFASHNEDEYHPDYPNFVEDEDAFWESRDNLIAYAQMLTSHGVEYDFQTDWNFLLAVQAYDQGDASTNGKNVVQYLHEDLGVDVDPHSHENGGYNFVDVAYLISQLGVEPTGVVGGFIAGPAESSQLEYFWNLRKGERYPSATWTPEILWGGGTGQHQNESAYWISGVWRPASATEFDSHDASAPLPNVGNYSGTWEGLAVLLEKLENGELDPDGFYTATIMIDQSDMNAETREAYEAHILELADAVAEGLIVYSTITDTYSTWVSTTDAEPTILHYYGSTTSTGEFPSKKPLRGSF